MITINAPVLYIWWGIMKSTLEITKWGHLKDSKWSRHKIETFWGAHGAKTVEGPSKSQDFVQGTILNPSNGPI
jgi:hypothetical protein